MEKNMNEKDIMHTLMTIVLIIGSYVAVLNGIVGCPLLVFDVVCGVLGVSTCVICVKLLLTLKDVFETEEEA